ncbi:potassium-transporting ATPase subunit KdpC [Acetobacterium sp. KB-1]|jgi:K+-transporting ATPase ATPase C chain|uniref:potassium-transporting ATPase subunit KdpC n=1 Tax=Acetobacterium sp. KB-1 TaxID=2184575 RepID=UPI000DBEC65C|nr:potassium-transporting ATPase subunit KdpC [Acetobacterium sp. KB-1]AWW27636.1 potassium-transporting ATPase subunit C [Acetobacterium sp. KB-1]
MEKSSKESIVSKLRPVLVSFLVLTLICGVIYPVIVTSIAQIAFPNQANGSIITVTQENKTSIDVGSALIGQVFTEPQYLIGRPQGTSQLSPVSEEQKALIEERVVWWQALDPQNTGAIPSDLVTASGSGVDPNISPEAAEYQVKRIAQARNMSEKAVREVITRYTTGKLLGLWGEPGVNVLKVNLALDGRI